VADEDGCARLDIDNIRIVPTNEEGQQFSVSSFLFHLTCLWNNLYTIENYRKWKDLEILN